MPGIKVTIRRHNCKKNLRKNIGKILGGKPENGYSPYLQKDVLQRIFHCSFKKNIKSKQNEAG